MLQLYNEEKTPIKSRSKYTLKTNCFELKENIQIISKEMEIAQLLDKTPNRLYQIGNQKVTGTRLTEFYYGVIGGLNCDLFKIPGVKCDCKESLIWKLIPIHCTRCFGSTPTFYEFINEILKRNKYQTL